jgi:hypothetical protein
MGRCIADVRETVAKARIVRRAAIKHSLQALKLQCTTANFCFEPITNGASYKNKLFEALNDSEVTLRRCVAVLRKSLIVWVGKPTFSFRAARKLHDHGLWLAPFAFYDSGVTSGRCKQFASVPLEYGHKPCEIRFEPLCIKDIKLTDYVYNHVQISPVE